jgi:hypothetical protein
MFNGGRAWGTERSAGSLWPDSSLCTSAAPSTGIDAADFPHKESTDMQHTPRFPAPEAEAVASATRALFEDLRERRFDYVALDSNPSLIRLRCSTQALELALDRWRADLRLEVAHRALHDVVRVLRELELSELARELDHLRLVLRAEVSR